MAGVGLRRGIKKNRSYTYDEAARAMAIHKNTIRGWVRSGDLLALTGERPHLIVGEDLIAFLKTRSAKRKTTLTLTQAYCLKCRAPREPALGMADLTISESGALNLRALCPACGGIMNRRISRAAIGELHRKLDLTVRQEPKSL